MSKLDAQRAMREARHARRTSGAAAPSRAPVRPATKTLRSASAESERLTLIEPEASPAAEAPCGHRNMSGRTCTREQGHSAKSHRYS